MARIPAGQQSFLEFEINYESEQEREKERQAYSLKGLEW